MTTPRGPENTPSRKIRWGLRIFLCVVIAAESTCYGVISPLLPRLAADLTLSNLDIGLLMGAFTAGMLPVCVVLTTSRRQFSDLPVLLVGILTVATGCLAFANIAGFTGPLVGRYLIGAGSALCFSGGTQWLVKTAPGAEVLYFGLGWGMLSVGTALGPLLGSLAAAHGGGALHNSLAGAFAVFAVCLMAAARSPQLRRMTRSRRKLDSGAPTSLLSDRTFRGALGPVIVPALAIGLAFTLIPMRFARSGDEHWVGLVFTAAALVGAAAGPLAGMAVRRLGARPVTIMALALGAVLMLMLGWPVSPGAVALATIVILGASNEVATVGASELIRTAGDELGSPDVAPVFVTLIFAVFETIGAVFAAKSQDLYTSLPYLTLGAIAAFTGLLMLRRPTGRQAG